VANAPQNLKVMLPRHEGESSFGYGHWHGAVFGSPKRNHPLMNCGQFRFVRLVNGRHENIAHNALRGAVIGRSVVLAGSVESSLAHQPEGPRPSNQSIGQGRAATRRSSHQRSAGEEYAGNQFWVGTRYDTRDPAAEGVAHEHYWLGGELTEYGNE
jgi:hypothetical protein